MADIKDKNELKRRIDLLLDELDYAINEEYCKETLKMMRQFIGHASNRIDVLESKLKAYKSKSFGKIKCDIGDKIYCIHCGEIETFECVGITIRKDSIYFTIKNDKFECYPYPVTMREFGKTAFTKESEAKKKLAYYKKKQKDKMSFREWLQWASKHRVHNDFREILPPLVLADGTELSVQASETHMCSPKRTLEDGNYESVEVYTHGEKVDGLYGLHEVSPFTYGYISIDTMETVCRFHGGIYKQ